MWSSKMALWVQETYKIVSILFSVVSLTSCQHAPGRSSATLIPSCLQLSVLHIVIFDSLSKPLIFRDTLSVVLPGVNWLTLLHMMTMKPSPVYVTMIVSCQVCSITCALFCCYVVHARYTAVLYSLIIFCEYWRGRMNDWLIVGSIIAFCCIRCVLSV